MRAHALERHTCELESEVGSVEYRVTIFYDEDVEAHEPDGRETAVLFLTKGVGHI